LIRIVWRSAHSSCPSFNIGPCVTALALTIGLLPTVASWAGDRHPAPLPVANSQADSERQMKAYDELIEHSRAKIAMLPIPGGQFTMGSPTKEDDRQADEGPQRQIKISPFWMAECEITWNAYEIWMVDMDVLRRQVEGKELTVRDKLAEEFQISKPTEPYTDMSFGMGKRGYPAICMTQHAARIFCHWLSAKTGRYYRLPTEAEWEYACRAGTTTAYSFGDTPEQIDDYAWYYDNSNEKYQKVRKKKPNPWGLFDMHGNVSEWVLDQHDEATYGAQGGKLLTDPLAVPLSLYPRVVRGGSWDEDPDTLRSAARAGSHEDWKMQDPQEPVSIWYHTDALHVGFRIVRPLVEPSAAQKAAKWEKTQPIQLDPEA
jgi:formylglycine-generating enzyme required for sulfatase activity